MKELILVSKSLLEAVVSLVLPPLTTQKLSFFNEEGRVSVTHQQDPHIEFLSAKLESLLHQLNFLFPFTKLPLFVFLPNSFHTSPIFPSPSPLIKPHPHRTSQYPSTALHSALSNPPSADSLSPLMTSKHHSPQAFHSLISLHLERTSAAIYS